MQNMIGFSVHETVIMSLEHLSLQEINGCKFASGTNSLDIRTKVVGLIGQ